MTAAGWEVVKRLGIQTFTCEYCEATSLLHLLPKGGLIDSQHWRVEQRQRCAGFDSWAPRIWLACSQECARDLAAQNAREYGRCTLPKMRFSVHGPYTPAESVESR